MKTIKNTLCLAVICLSLVFTGCNKNDDGGATTSAGPGTLSAKVDGASYSGDVVALATEITAGGVTTIRLQSSDATGKAILILINAFNGVGTYEFSTATSIAHVATYTEANISNPTATKSWVAPYSGSGLVGQVAVSEKTATAIKGTFNFSGKEQNGTTMKVITEGAFNLNFQ